MKRIFALLICAVLNSTAHAQLLTWTPDFPKDNDNIVITLDATKGNQGLNNYADPNNIYVHIGVTTNLSNNGGMQWLYVNGTTGGTYGSATPALKATSLGNNKYQFTINNIRTFFGVPAGEIIKSIGILFRDANANTGAVKKAANADGSDMFIPVYDNTIATRFITPVFQPTFARIPEPISKQVGDNIALTAIANKSSVMKLFLNGTEIQSANNVTTISANPVITTAGTQTVRIDAIDGATTKSESFQFFASSAVTILPLPIGVKDGINYEAGGTAATLVLYAPNKGRVSVIGEFPGKGWTEQPGSIMNKTADGNYWWIRLTGLTPGTEYAFQYLVDGTLKVGDPYAEKILDPNNDQFISATTYPALKAYPTGQTTGIVSVLQTNAPTYTWGINNFTRPDKRNLVIYELLLRDFIGNHDWKTLKDTLSYLKRLGVNAIEVMPFNEFEGNLSWGYNGYQYFAPDKYYGPKNTLKEFIDSCHKNGIAVIMDIVLNHTYGPSPLAQLYWDAANNRPAANNPWYNTVQPHAFGFGEDFNHESTATKYFFSRVLQHWVGEYKIDGYRVDFSKGLTQKVSTNDAAFSAYDASRIAILNNYSTAIKTVIPDPYIILEHFADDAEELELSNSGFMLWSNVWTQYQEASMGYLGNSNFERGIHTTRGWTNPALVTFMESHDEERITFKNGKYGNSSGAYSVKDFATSLKRMELNAAFMLTIPGPKMIYQFGELGYDFSRCYLSTNGEGGDCNTKTDAKPIRWDYQQVAQRKQLYDVYSSLNKLRFQPLYKDVFIANNINLTRNLGGGVKSITIRSANDTSMLAIVGNFDVTAQTTTFSFPAAGTWYDYISGSTITATGAAQSITLQPGEYHIYLNRNLAPVVVVPVTPVTQLAARITPTPTRAASATVLEIAVPSDSKVQADLFNSMGQSVRNILNERLVKGKYMIPLTDKISNLAAGVYLMKIDAAGKTVTTRLVIQ